MNLILAALCLYFIGGINARPDNYGSKQGRIQGYAPPPLKLEKI